MTSFEDHLGRELERAAARRPRRVRSGLAAVPALVAAIAIAIVVLTGGRRTPEHSVRPSVTPLSVPLAVANGTSIQGLAGDYAGQLRRDGWNVRGLVKADIAGHADPAFSQVAYAPGHEAQARAVGRQLHLTVGSARAVPFTLADVVVVVGTNSVLGRSPVTAGRRPATPEQTQALRSLIRLPVRNVMVVPPPPGTPHAPGGQALNWLVGRTKTRICYSNEGGGACGNIDSFSTQGLISSGPADFAAYSLPTTTPPGAGASQISRLEGLLPEQFVRVEALSAAGDVVAQARVVNGAFELRVPRSGDLGRVDAVRADGTRVRLPG